MRVAFLSLDSPVVETTWSGIAFYALQEIKRRFSDVHEINTPRVDYVLRRSGFLKRFGILPRRAPISARYLSWAVERKLKAIEPDIVIAMNAEHKVAYIPEHYRVILCVGALFGNIVNYYQEYKSLNRRAIEHGDNQQKALFRANVVTFLGSSWSAQAAAQYYSQPVSRFKVVPMGANFDEEPAAGVVRSNTGPLKLLFVGYDWRRKGGDIVVEVFNRLREQLGNVELHIAGCTPEETKGMEGVVQYGRLRKSVRAEADRLEQLFVESSLFIMPSRQELYGLVYCEACAYGLPVIASQTGGVGEIVVHGKSGVLLHHASDIGDYVKAIVDVWTNDALYRDMQIAARQSYVDRLNWRVWGDALETEIRRLAQ